VVDLRNCTDTTLVDRFGAFTLTLMAVGEEDEDEEDVVCRYSLKAKDNKEAVAWVDNLKVNA